MKVEHQSKEEEEVWNELLRRRQRWEVERNRERVARCRQRKKEQNMSEEQREKARAKNREATRRSRANMSEEKKKGARAKQREAMRRARLKKKQSSQKREKVLQVCQEACKNKEGEVWVTFYVWGDRAHTAILLREDTTTTALHNMKKVDTIWCLRLVAGGVWYMSKLYWIGLILLDFCADYSELGNGRLSKGHRDQDHYCKHIAGHYLLRKQRCNIAGAEMMNLFQTTYGRTKKTNFGLKIKTIFICLVPMKLRLSTSMYTQHSYNVSIDIRVEDQARRHASWHGAVIPLQVLVHNTTYNQARQYSSWELIQRPWSLCHSWVIYDKQSWNCLAANQYIWPRRGVILLSRAASPTLLPTERYCKKVPFVPTRGVGSSKFVLPCRLVL